MIQPHPESAGMGRERAKRPFALDCRWCSHPAPPPTRAAAKAAGWVEIQAEPDGLWWTHMGTCPECAAKAREVTFYE